MRARSRAAPLVRRGGRRGARSAGCGRRRHVRRRRYLAATRAPRRCSGCATCSPPRRRRRLRGPRRAPRCASRSSSSSRARTSCAAARRRCHLLDALTHALTLDPAGARRARRPDAWRAATSSSPFASRRASTTRPPARSRPWRAPSTGTRSSARVHFDLPPGGTLVVRVALRPRRAVRCRLRPTTSSSRPARSGPAACAAAAGPLPRTPRAPRGGRRVGVPLRLRHGRLRRRPCPTLRRSAATCSRLGAVGVAASVRSARHGAHSADHHRGHRTLFKTRRYSRRTDCLVCFRYSKLRCVFYYP